MISAAEPAAKAVRRTTPLQPVARKARVKKISDSHSCAVHGAPAMEWLNGSTRGTSPWARIQEPVATCDQVSPSLSTSGRDAAMANAASARNATMSAETRALQRSAFAPRLSLSGIMRAIAAQAYRGRPLALQPHSGPQCRMSTPSLSLPVIVAVTFFVAGVVKGVTGMGLPTVAMGALGALLSPLTAAGLLIVPAFVTNVWQLVSGPSFAPLLRRLWPMMAAVVAGTFGGASLLTGGNVRLGTSALGAALAAYASFSLAARPPSVSARLEPWLGPVVGGATGLVTGGTGVFVLPAVPYLQALGLGKDDLVQALGLSFTVSTVALAAALAARGALRLDNLALSSLAVVPALLGMGAGQAVRARVSAETFRRWFLIALLIFGAEMASRPLFMR